MAVPRSKRGLKKGGKEAKKGILTPKKERFCQEYVLDFNATQAAIRAGFSTKSAYSIGSALTRKVECQRRIMELQNTAATEYNVTKQRLISILMDIAGAKIEDILDEEGEVLPPQQWPEHMKRVVTGMESDELYSGFGPLRQNVGLKRKVKFADKTKAVELLNRMLGFNMPDKVAQTTPEGEGVTPVIKIYTVPPKNDDE